MEDSVGRMAQMAEMIQALRHETLTLQQQQQQQETLLQNGNDRSSSECANGTIHGSAG